jgi:hypothetical protein
MICLHLFILIDTTRSVSPIQMRGQKFKRHSFNVIIIWYGTVLDYLLTLHIFLSVTRYELTGTLI